jgi:hypothetical protein
MSVMVNAGVVFAVTAIGPIAVMMRIKTKLIFNTLLIVLFIKTPPKVIKKYTTFIISTK